MSTSSTINTVNKIDDLVPVRNIIISTADKSGLERFVPELVSISQDVRIYSTGNTFRMLKDVMGTDWERNLQTVSGYTGQPEMQGGLVKTLDYRIYLGLLSETYNDAHRADLKRADAIEFDMVVGNLYPFREVVSSEDATLENARGNIDIGGPCMIRAAAKNYLRVTVICDPADYDTALAELRNNRGSISLKTRFRFAQKAFTHTAEYDSAISTYLNSTSPESCESTYDVVGR